MKNPNPRSFIGTILPNKNPYHAEINSLLQLITEPAVIIESARQTIQAVNLHFLKLTSFARNEVIEKSLNNFIEGQPSIQFQNESETAITLRRSHRSAIPVNMKLKILGTERQFFAAIFSDMVARDTENGIVTSRYLEMFDSVICSPLMHDKKYWFDNIVKIVSPFLETDSICFYLVEPDSPEICKMTRNSQTEKFPDILPPTDLTRLQETYLWVPGKRVLTEIHRFGRIHDFSYMGTTPLGHPNANIGLVVIAGKNQSPVDDLPEILKFLSSFITNEIERSLLISNLANQSNEQMDRLGILEAQFENAQEGICVLNPELKVLFINPAAEWMLGYSGWEVVNQSVENILIGPKNLMPSLEAALKGISTPNIQETSLHRRDGHAFPAQLQVNPILKEDKLKAILVNFRDVSEHEEIMARTQQLEHRALLGDVTSVFAHEVRNPINNISTGLQLVASRMDKADPNWDVITRIQSDCVRLNDLMESVLAFSRPVEQKFEPVDIKALLQRLVDRWRPRMSKVNVNPFYECELEDATVYGNYRSLEQVFINLISNAVDAMSRSGGTLAIKVNRMELARNRQQLNITVSDNGPGIPDEIKKKLFEPFVTNKPQGTGLGLAITRKIITAHHGSIDVDSFPGGTIFHVILPASDGESR